VVVVAVVVVVIVVVITGGGEFGRRVRFWRHAHLSSNQAICIVFESRLHFL
jgi:hypothetical protein